jgi:hypothetical protein
MRVIFTHPNTSDYLEAEVDGDKTAAECLQAMIDHGMLERADHRLVVNGRTMTPDESLNAAGVVDGSTVGIVTIQTGASRVCSYEANKRVNFFCFGSLRFSRRAGQCASSHATSPGRRSTALSSHRHISPFVKLEVRP